MVRNNPCTLESAIFSLKLVHFFLSSGYNPQKIKVSVYWAHAVWLQKLVGVRSVSFYSWLGVTSVSQGLHSPLVESWPYSCADTKESFVAIRFCFSASSPGYDVPTKEQFISFHCVGVWFLRLILFSFQLEVNFGLYYFLYVFMYVLSILVLSVLRLKIPL